MTNTDFAENVRFTAEMAVRREESARAVLVDVVTAGRQIDSYTLKPVMEAQAKAQPWRQVLQRMKKVDAAKAVESVREDCMEVLMRGESQSTCAITNETDRLARDAARNFLRETRRMG
jgi:membrane-bound lytic murein transglycosylase